MPRAEQPESCNGAPKSLQPALPAPLNTDQAPFACVCANQPTRDKGKSQDRAMTWRRQSPPIPYLLSWVCCVRETIWDDVERAIREQELLTIKNVLSVTNPEKAPWAAVPNSPLPPTPVTGPTPPFVWCHRRDGAGHLLTLTPGPREAGRAWRQSRMWVPWSVSVSLLPGRSARATARPVIAGTVCFQFTEDV